MKKTIVTLAVVLLAGLAAYFGYHSYQLDSERAQLAEREAAEQAASQRRKDEIYKRLAAEAEARRLAEVQARQNAQAAEQRLAESREIGRAHV